MDQLIADIEAYAAARGIAPTSVVQAAVNASGTAWARWKSGGACSVRTMDRIRNFIAENPPAALAAVDPNHASSNPENSHDPSSATDAA